MEREHDDKPKSASDGFKGWFMRWFALLVAFPILFLIWPGQDSAWHRIKLLAGFPFFAAKEGAKELWQRWHKRKPGR